MLTRQFAIQAVFCMAGLFLGACSSEDSLTAPVPGGPSDPDWATWEQDIGPADGDVFYLDPDGGDIDNPGTSAEPWPGLAEVLAADLIQRWVTEDYPHEVGAPLHLANPDAPVGPGDRLLLRDGDHGDCTFMDAHNPGYIFIGADAGAEPVLQRLRLTGVEKLVVEDLTIRGEAGGDLSGTLLFIETHSWRGPCTHISVRDCTVESTSDIVGWTDTDWNDRAASGVSATGSYIALHRNTICNVNFGFSLSGDCMLAAENLVENFCGDGMRGNGNDQIIQYNTIRNCYDVNENHDDGFQSFSVNGQPPRERMVLRGNVIIGYTDPDQPYRGTLQGIGCFDGFYIDWVVENNLVVTDHWHGITLLGADGCRIVNNTVVDLNDSDPGPPWIMIGDHKDGRSSTSCLIRNNIARTISAGSGVAADHNLETTDLEVVFEDPAGLDFRPRQDGPAVDAGSGDLAPETDIDGTMRPQGGGVDLGAYER